MTAPPATPLLPPGALEGVRVLDLTRVLAGPWCGQILADLGAEVIKVERPESGDDTRSWGPPFLKDENGNDTQEATYYLAANRGKKSVTIDIATRQGQAEVRRLVARSDVLLENYKVGQLAKYGLDYASLKAQKPSLIYCSITGFGQTGPWSHRPGYDFIIQALSGFMSVTGAAEDFAGGPQKAGVAISDLFTGVYAGLAVVSALYHRQRTGEGQHLDMALLDVMVSSLANLNTSYLATGVVPGRTGNAHANIVPYQTLPCADGYIVVAVGNDAQFQRFCSVLGDAGLAQDERFETNPQRVRHRGELVPILEAKMRLRSKNDWVDALEAANVPCGPINNLDEVFANPQVQARGLRVDLPHPLAGTVHLVGNPIKMSVTPPAYKLPPPLLGEHNNEILADLLAPSQYDDRR
ncbi:MAG: CaiB/BaiF CoA-transferase family protein [Burkholderiaceae bacterium]|jgi:formyl-CoA transferase